MEKSNEIKDLAKSLQLFQIKMDPIKKDASNPFFKSKYATLSNILESISTPLTESGLIFTQHPEEENTLTTILIHVETGQYLQSTYKINPIKTDPQALGSAITYARRYALASILGLNIEDDDDGNAASHPLKMNGINNNSQKMVLNENHPHYLKIKEAIKNGTRTISLLRNTFEISKEIENKLLN